MRYRNWLISEYPELQNSTDSEISRIVVKAEKETKYTRGLVAGVVFGFLIYITGKLGQAVNVEIYRGLEGWLLILAGLFVANHIFKFFDKSLVKKSIANSRKNAA